jgi:diguanylate cyclase (GGDEF)-like protein/PAS domain S-box-containing protein
LLAAGMVGAEVISCKQLLARIRAAYAGAAAGWASAAREQATPLDLTEVLAHSADCVAQTDASGALIYLNHTAREVLGLGPHSPIKGLRFADLAASGAQRQLVREILPALQSRGVWLGEINLRLGARRKVPFSLMAMAHRQPDGSAQRFSAVMRDISADVVVRQQIQRQNNILSAITEAMPATVVIVDSQGRYRFVNSAFERYVGLSAQQILGRTAVDVLGPQEVARRKPYMQKAIAGEAVAFTLDYPGEQGTTYLALNCIPLKLDGVLDGFVGISQDVTSQRREQARLADLAERDPLTGLLNRAGLAQRVDDKLWRGEGQELALLYIDLDHFKPVNDQLGHQAGDQLLQMFAHRLEAAVRNTDVVARLGGDEFVILLCGVRDLATAQVVADKVLAAASQPFEIEGQRVQVSASIGVAVSTQGDGGLRELLHRADGMLYRAKAAGRGRQASAEQVPSPEPA